MVPSRFRAAALLARDHVRWGFQDILVGGAPADGITHAAACIRLGRGGRTVRGSHRATGLQRFLAGGFEHWPRDRERAFVVAWRASGRRRAAEIIIIRSAEPFRREENSVVREVPKRVPRYASTPDDVSQRRFVHRDHAYAAR